MAGADSPQFVPVLKKIRVRLPVGASPAPGRGRNTVERLINRMKDWRGIATRFDKTPESYLAGLELRASMIWLGGLLEAAD
jgi:hypothetical protein